MNYLTAILLLLVNFLGIGQSTNYNQNLIRNGSFENQYHNSGYLRGVYYWNKPPNDGNTPDYFENFSTGNCYPGGCLGNDHTFAGDIYAFHQESFMGGLAYYIQGGQINGRENIQQELEFPLKSGKTYQIGFSIRLGDKCKYFVDGYGMYLSKTAPSPTNVPPYNDVILVSPQIELETTFGPDTAWVTISGFYVANGGEKFVTLGNFNIDESTHIRLNPNYDSTLNPHLFRDEGSYFFIDDVFIYPMFKNEEFGLHTETPNIALTLFPNPVKNELHFNLKGINDSFDLTIYNTLGKNVQSYTNNTTDQNIYDLSALENGVYIVDITLNKNGQNIRRKIVVRHS